ncbi:RTA1 like protein [Penicillium verhagenii]|uniref:RTA1 like protein n=1 Tax=Penicillium verhagenii TaxID=1562060 RepID=UPI0025453A1A|nr:RTA1 like protein [Penicillium verhagenii]KAJ5947874.1 RTA1 like protein [Penicillium verhagenii]
MAKLEPLKGGYYVWQYVPSMAAAAIFLILFLATTSFHFWKIFRTKVKFTWPFAIGGLFEIIGYATRIDAHNNTGKLMPYCIQSVFILLGPILFAASVYMVLARIIRAVHGEKHSLLPLRWVTKTFVLSDVATFWIQAGGAGMMVSSSLSKIGQGIVLAGLALQVLSFCIFIITAYMFQTGMHRRPTAEAFDPYVPWKQHLYALYGVSALILVRSIFRLVEYAMGNQGYPLSNEWMLYVFDAVPMFIAMVIFGIWHPTELKPFLVTARSSESSDNTAEETKA